MARAVARVAVAVLHGQQTTYTLYTPEGKRNLVVRSGSPDTFALDQLTAPFGLTFTEDRVANGLVIGTRKGRIVAIPGQSFIQVGRPRRRRPRRADPARAQYLDRADRLSRARDSGPPSASPSSSAGRRA